MRTTAAALPSSDSARRLVLGAEGALGDVLLHAAGRSILLYVGGRVAGLEHERAVPAALASSLAIEAFALWWFWYNLEDT